MKAQWLSWLGNVQRMPKKKPSNPVNNFVY